MRRGAAGCGHRLAIRNGRSGPGQRVARVEPGHDVQEERGVRDIARHRAVHREVVEAAVGRASWHAARRRAQAHHRAEGARRAQAAAEVRAVCEPDLPGGERHRRAAGGARAGERGVPRVAGDAEHLVEGLPAGAELGRVRLREHDAARGLDPEHGDVRLVRHMVGIDGRAVCGAHALDGIQVLDRDRQAGQQAALAGRALHQLAGPLARALRRKRRQRIDPAVNRLYTRQRGVYGVERRDVAGLEPCDGFAGGQSAEIVGHGIGIRSSGGGTLPIVKWRVAVRMAISRAGR